MKFYCTIFENSENNIYIFARNTYKGGCQYDISSHTLFLPAFFGELRRHNIFVVSMCKIEKGKIQRRINEEIRRNFQNIKWAGIKIENVAKLNTIQVNLSNNFQYNGKGNYPFEGTIEFQEIIFPEKDTLSRFYQFSPSNRVYLEEGKEDVEIKINEPILVTPKL